MVPRLLVSPSERPASGNGSVVSANAYVGGLAWRAAQAHPMGYSQLSFGYWASPPPSLRSFGVDLRPREEPMADQPQYDVVIVGAGIAGSIIASELAAAGKRVLILDAGQGVPDNRGQYMDNFYLSNAKTPESPYPPLGRLPGREATPRATIAGLNVWTDPEELPDPAGAADAPAAKPSLCQHLPSASAAAPPGTGWAPRSASCRTTSRCTPTTTFSAPAPTGRSPTRSCRSSMARPRPRSASRRAWPSRRRSRTRSVSPSRPATSTRSCRSRSRSSTRPSRRASPASISPVSNGKPVFVTPTPAGRNSQPYQNRRVCAGNTNCIPICPIQAKYDATVTLAKALNTGKVTVIYKAVASKVLTDENGRISGSPVPPLGPRGRPHARRGADGDGGDLRPRRPRDREPEAAAALRQRAVSQGARQPQRPGGTQPDGSRALSVVGADAGGAAGLPLPRAALHLGIESLRDGEFRRERAAFRMEIGNEGWNFPIGDPYVTVQDFINGTNNSRLNPVSPPSLVPFPPPAGPALGGVELALAVNDRLTRQFRIACLLEQAPQASNRVTLDPTRTDGLGLARPKISYGLDPYTLDGFAAARETSSAIYQQMSATEFTDYSQSTSQPGYFEYEGVPYVLFGAGHLVGTHRMGTDRPAR